MLACLDNAASNFESYLESVHIGVYILQLPTLLCGFVKLGLQCLV